MTAPITAEEISIREIICDRVLLAWEASGLGKRAFAHSIGISAPLLSNYARYKSTPSHTVLARICQRYGIPPSFFYPDAAKKRAVSTPVVQRALDLAAARERGAA